MSIDLLFWLLMILSLIFGFWRGYSDPANRYGFGMSLFLWILLFLIGWRVFGFPIQG